MTIHHPPFGWVAPAYKHYVEDEPDSVQGTTGVGYDHIAGRMGSDVKMQLDGASGETRMRHTVVSTLRVTEPDVRRIADAGTGFVGVSLRCQLVNFSIEADPEGLSSEFNAHLSTVVSAAFALAPDKSLSTHQFAGPAVGRPELFVISSTAGGRSLKPANKVEEPATAQDVRKIVFKFAGIEGWDRSSPLDLNLTLTNAVLVSSNDFSFKVSFASDWLLNECVVSTAEPYALAEIDPGVPTPNGP